MKKILVNDIEYTLEFSFSAVEIKELIQKMFMMLSGGYVAKRAKDVQNPTSEEIVDGSGYMIAEFPHVCKTAFYAGLLENHNGITQDEAITLMKSYMKENKLSFVKLYGELTECMEDDGFFDLSGLKDMLVQAKESMEQKSENTVKMPKDHMKKQTGTK